ncbi:MULTISPECIES: inorganic phosphate transporter [Kribbella]|uniref:Phosphate transporter n=1 Tax=Kribbella pratensis TaxID=2512112 RepID=A0ABY2FGY0_9ACTN|nr:MULTISPECIES: inorganic phosphate transporter [Kribbella]TDW90637.1 PiT family inorganic phosphate transporter [Kribbella pratensis]TDW98369.1 PiT family inorganic phosphate transporter [Kribbella sp. VKM Ac-2566]
MDLSFLVVVVIVTALVFDFTNGFHDTANAMATSIATGALKPKIAVALSAVLNLVGAFISTEVAKTISSGIVDDAKVTVPVIFGGLVGAILWNLLTWYLGLPSSSSHALFGGLIGATWIASGSSAVHFGTVVQKIIVPAIAAPVVAGAVALLGTYLAYKITARARKKSVDDGFRAGQIASASLVSLAHGTGDAQKTMGVITLVLITSGSLASGSRPPLWVILAAGLAIAAGTYLGGWRIIRTMGKGLAEIESPQGFSAETSSTAVLLASSHLGFPLSTTQVCSGSILGAGLGKRLAEVRWTVAGRMAVAWLLTLPAAAIVGALSGRVADSGNLGVVIIAVLAVAAGGGIYAASRRRPVTSENVNEYPSSTTPSTTAAAA